MDEFLASGNLRGAVDLVRSDPDVEMTESRFLEVFRCVETRTREAEENFFDENDSRTNNGAAYPPASPARTEMTQMYAAMKARRHLLLYGAVSDVNYPVGGDKIVTPVLLERITDLNMTALTPAPTNTVLLAGVVCAVLEGVVAALTGVNYNLLVGGTILLASIDVLLLNGAVFETLQSAASPEYAARVSRHEAGHFLLAYLLGCPVEGCVLSARAALADPRFGGRRSGVAAGTSFFDPELSDGINRRRPLSRSVVDRYTVVVMGGIAAEALRYGGADGGASDEEALVRFLSTVAPRGGGATRWSGDGEAIRNQARWGAAQAVRLLRRYEASHEALATALERNAGLGECVLAIEEAARTAGTVVPTTHEGLVEDDGLFGRWVDDPERLETYAKRYSSSSGDDTSFRSTTTSREETEQSATPANTKTLLRDSRDLLEQKLKDIEKQLADMEDVDNAQ